MTKAHMTLGSGELKGGGGGAYYFLSMVKSPKKNHGFNNNLICNRS
jgi:hypothetical protein